MILRDATPQDAQALAALGRESFCAAFGTLYDPADLDAFLTSAYSVEAVAEEIAAPGITHQLAQDPASGALTGYIKMRHPSNYAHHSTAVDPVELGQLYCDGAHTGKGIGAMLMEWALHFARAGGHDAILLSVYSENFGAQRFYQRYGFAKIADIDFWVGAKRDDEFLYELRL
jgi:ribosomal protein S18 acetylase RimI-like enzyme